MLYDRSWYNRAGVERVMGFCTLEEHADFLRMTPLFEKQVVSEGVRLIKYFFDVSRDVQEQRFLARVKDPLRQWKISPMDIESWRRWWNYTAAYAEMIERTDTQWAPWYCVQTDVRRNARLNCSAHLLSQIPYEELPVERPEFGKRRKRPQGIPEALTFSQRVPQRY